MISVHCHTNLDLAGERWPTKFPAVPRIGDTIASATTSGSFRLELKVVAVRWEIIAMKWDCDGVTEVVSPHVELHMTDFHRSLPCSIRESGRGSIRAFYEWYAPLVGKSVASFI